jgi:acetyl esterase/lipase
LLRLQIKPLGSAKAANRHGEISTNSPGYQPSLAKRGEETTGSNRMAQSKLALAIVATMLITAAGAESPMPEELVWKLLELGPAIDGPSTAKIYAPLQEKEPYQGIKVERDVKYGAADRNLLDVFTPASASQPRPVLIFVHGGAFVAGDRREPRTPFFDNIMLWAVRNGFVGVNMTYRLAPQAKWPAGAEDIGSAVQWVANNIGGHGGDPARIYLMGHSAGAVHVASYVSHPEFYKVKGSGVAGAIMVSGLYDLTAMQLGDPERAYFGADPSRYAGESSLQGLATTSIPLMIVAAEMDPAIFLRQFELLKDATCKTASGCTRALILPQHSHMSEVYSINTEDTRLTDQILDFVKAGK